MIKISKITTQKRNKSRYNIFLDDGQGEKYAFSVDEEVLIEFNLRKGQELTESMIIKLRAQDSFHKSYAKVINYLGYRMRTEKEIRDYLVKDEVDIEHIDKIIRKLLERDLIDDNQFAAMFVGTRIKMSTKGPGLVRKELIAKGVSAKSASEAVEQYSFEVQYERASKLTKKRMGRRSKHSYRKQLQQLQAALMRNGFTQEVIQAIIADLQQEESGEGEWDALVHQGEKLISRHEKKFSGFELRNKVKEALYRQGFALREIDLLLEEKLKRTD